MNTLNTKYFHRPVTPFSINQRFGDNTICISTDGANKIISCNGKKPPAGYTSLYGKSGHKGIDLRATHGQEVYNAATGRIYQIDTNPRTGLDVRIESILGGRKFRHIYEHLLGYQGKVGDLVLTGQLIGWADNTGYSSGDHLHFEVQEEINGKWVAIDPLPLMSEHPAINVLRDVNTMKYIKELLAIFAERYMVDSLRKRS